MRSLSLWNTQGPVQLFSSLDELLSDFDKVASADTPIARFAPKLDIEEQAEAYYISVDLPGVKKEEIKIDMKDDVLTLSGERVREAKGEGRRRERAFGAFSRTFNLPKQIDREKIQASFENGVLHLTLPKAAAAQAREIKIQ